MINLKACTRCGGDLLAEEILGEIDLVCLQCGHRSPAPARASAYTKTRRPRRRQNQKLAA